MEEFSMSSEDWSKKWQEGKTDFHSEKLSEAFIQKVDKLINVQRKAKVFVPLCGKAVEMKWLWDNGHEIVGVECSEVALKQFFEENKIDYNVEDVPEIKGKRYKSREGNIRLYCCNFYDFTPSVEHDFGAVWDCGALNAINMEDQEKYINILKSIMSEHCVNVTVIDDPEEWEITVTFEKIKYFFNDGFKIECSDYIKANDELKSQGIKGQHIYVISKL